MTTRVLTDQEIINDIYHATKFMYPSLSEEEAKDVLYKHWIYGTIDAVYRLDKLIACVRWNVQGDTFDILDLYIAPGERGTLLMKHLIARNWHRFPGVTKLRFERNTKYPNREWRCYDIAKILKVRL